jgi:hypothetical protein
MDRIKRPTNMLQCGKPKRVDPAPDEFKLVNAAAAAIYGSSEYHCRGPKGEPPKRRAKPASICPRKWNNDEATEALRMALKKGWVSETWDEGFPRYVWHREGTVMYEARHTRGPIGTFHAYPIEPFQSPNGLDL